MDNFTSIFKKGPYEIEAEVNGDTGEIVAARLIAPTVEPLSKFDLHYLLINGTKNESAANSW